MKRTKFGALALAGLLAFSSLSTNVALANISLSGPSGLTVSGAGDFVYYPVLTGTALSAGVYQYQPTALGTALFGAYNAATPQTYPLSASETVNGYASVISGDGYDFALSVRGEILYKASSATYYTVMTEAADSDTTTTTTASPAKALSALINAQIGTNTGSSNAYSGIAISSNGGTITIPAGSRTWGVVRAEGLSTNDYVVAPVIYNADGDATQTLTLKTSPVSLTKTLDDSDTTTVETDHSTTVDLGEVVNYTVSADVPTYNGISQAALAALTTPPFTLTDTPTGLTITASTIQVYKGASVSAGTLLASGTDYAVNVAATGVMTLTLSGAQANALRGEKLWITYSAVVNDNAPVGNAGDNKVKYTYWNGIDTNELEAETVVKTYEFKIDKKDGDNDTHLDGVTFNLYKITDTTAITTLTATQLTAMTTGATPTAFQYTNGGSAAISTTAGAASSNVYTATLSATAQANATVAVDANGVITVSGVDDGYYVLSEVSAPTGYAQLADPVVIRVNGTTGTITINGATETGYTGAYTITPVQNSSVSTTTGAPAQQMDVKNYKGVSLPETGAFGMIRIMGIALAGIGASLAYLFVAKRRRRES